MSLTDSDIIVGNAGSSTIPGSYAVTVKDALEARGVKMNYEQGGDNGFTYTGANY